MAIEWQRTRSAALVLVYFPAYTFIMFICFAATSYLVPKAAPIMPAAYAWPVSFAILLFFTLLVFILALSKFVVRGNLIDGTSIDLGRFLNQSPFSNKSLDARGRLRVFIFFGFLAAIAAICFFVAIGPEKFTSLDPNVHMDLFLLSTVFGNVIYLLVMTAGAVRTFPLTRGQPLSGGHVRFGRNILLKSIVILIYGLCMTIGFTFLFNAQDILENYFRVVPILLTGTGVFASGYLLVTWLMKT